MVLNMRTILQSRQGHASSQRLTQKWRNLTTLRAVWWVLPSRICSRRCSTISVTMAWLRGVGEVGEVEGKGWPSVCSSVWLWAAELFCHLQYSSGPGCPAQSHWDMVITVVSSPEVKSDSRTDQCYQKEMTVQGFSNRGDSAQMGKLFMF